MIYLFIFLFQSNVFAALDAKYDDFDGFPLVERLVADGKWADAEKEIKGLISTDAHLASYWWGVVEFKKGNHKAAEQKLLAAKLGKETSQYSLKDIYLGRVQLQLEKYKECAQSYERVADKTAIADEDTLSWSLCYKKTKQFDKAWSIISPAVKTSRNIQILEFANTLLVELKVLYVSLNLSLEWLSRHGAVSSDFLSIADFYGKNKFSDGQMKVLEMARLRFPLDVDIQLSMNQLFYEKGMLLAVEEGFSRAAIVDKKYAYHAAEMNRQVGRYERSLYFNSLIPDESEKLRQKLAIYVDKNQFAMIASLESILLRSPLIKDDEVRYALSYSLVKMGEYQRPLQYLAQITQREFLEKAVILRNALADCVENGKVCQL